MGRALVVLWTAAVVAAGCSSDEPGATASTTAHGTTAASSPTSSAPTPEGIARAEALAAYEAYWAASNAASRQPGRPGGWRHELAMVAADPALGQRLDSLANYASVPAHFEGEPRRAPTATSVSLTPPMRVVVVDCIDVSGWRLVSDKPGEQGRNLNDPDQPQRYSFTAQVVRYDDPPRWLVQTVQADVRQPC